MKPQLFSRYWTPLLVSTLLAIAVVVAIVIGFAKNPVWGAVITASSSAILTCITLAQSWQEKKDLYRPRVVFYVHRDGDDVLFNLSNTGLRPAFHVSITLDRPIWFRVGDLAWGDLKLKDLREVIGFLYQPVAFLAPEQTLTTVNQIRSGNDNKLTETILDRFVHSDPEHQNEGIGGLVSYEDEQGRRYTDRTEIGFLAMKNMKLMTTVRRS